MRLTADYSNLFSSDPSDTTIYCRSGACSSDILRLWWSSHFVSPRTGRAHRGLSTRSVAPLPRAADPASGDDTIRADPRASRGGAFRSVASHREQGRSPYQARSRVSGPTASRYASRRCGPTALLLASPFAGFDETGPCPGRRSSVVEQLIRNQQVLGSSPSAGSKPHNSLERSEAAASLRDRPWVAAGLQHELLAGAGTGSLDLPPNATRTRQAPPAGSAFQNVRSHFSEAPVSRLQPTAGSR
jgi:hypothetical protein